MRDVVIYTTHACPYCRMAERFLTERNIPFKGIDVTNDEAMRAKLVEMTGGKRTVPQIFIGGTSVGGYTDLVALQQQGKLDALING
jgi:glutaredoxin 3